VDSDQAPVTPELSDKILPGLTREWYSERRVVVYKLTAVSEEIVNRWAETVQQTLKDWDKAQPYLAIHDLSQAGVSLQYAALVNFDMMNIGVTMEGRMQTDNLFDLHPEWSAKVAVTFNLSLSGQTNRTLMNFFNREHPAIRYKTYYSRSKAMRWLLGDGSDTSEVKSVSVQS
jgi:hypothetical protein